MMYKFIRTGHRPFEDCAGEEIVRGCFEPCTPEIKAELDKFLSEGRETITFEFEDSVVTLRRVKNCREVA